MSLYSIWQLLLCDPSKLIKIRMYVAPYVKCMITVGFQCPFQSGSLCLTAIMEQEVTS